MGKVLTEHRPTTRLADVIFRLGELYLRSEKQRRTAALQDAGAKSYALKIAKRPGVRQSSGAFAYLSKPALLPTAKPYFLLFFLLPPFCRFFSALMLRSKISSGVPSAETLTSNPCLR